MSPDPILPGLFLPCSLPRLLSAAAGGGLEPAPVRRFRGASPHRLLSYAKQASVAASFAHGTPRKCTEGKLHLAHAAIGGSDPPIVGAGHRRIRQPPHGVIQEIESLPTELELVAFLDTEILVRGKVPVESARTQHRNVRFAPTALDRPSNRVLRTDGDKLPACMRGGVDARLEHIQLDAKKAASGPICFARTSLGFCRYRSWLSHDSRKPAVLVPGRYLRGLWKSMDRTSTNVSFQVPTDFENGPDRRAFTRIKVRGVATVDCASGELHTCVIDMHECGMGIRSSKPLVPGLVVFVHYRSSKLIGFARVCYCRAYGLFSYRIGLDFQNFLKSEQAGRWHIQQVAA